MFENLTERLSQTLKNIRGKAKLSENNIKDTIREVRMALLEADTALPVVKEFINQIKEQAVGQTVQTSLSPGQAFVKIVQAELIKVMGTANNELNLHTQPPAIILIAGLQGSGKTTSVAKLGKFLKERYKKSVLIVSTDVYRPAAIKQLETLANEVNVEFFPANIQQKSIDIAHAAILEAKLKHIDVIIFDTTGRLHINTEMMEEIQELYAAINPIETLFVVDAMTGQDAANTAKAFGNALPLTGIILTKVDGDARGGAALSVRYITGKPIKFLGVGEKNDALDPFHPDRIASRILGMGDLLSLIEAAEQKIDKKKANKLTKKLKDGTFFNLEDFREQLQQMQQMGGLVGIIDKLPGMLGNMIGQIDNKVFVQMEAIINSMTPAERINPEILNSSRKKRIALGSGTHIQDINRLIKQYKKMSKIMKKITNKGGINKLFSGFGGIKGKILSDINTNGNRKFPF